MAHEDPLTGLPNRRAFDLALDDCVAAARPFSVLLVDVDRFKTINDTYGHTVGDEVLCAIAARTRGSVRSTDTLARIGGDELALVAPGSGVEGAARLASALHGAVVSVRPTDAAPPVTLTISCASYPEDGVDRHALLRAADTRLHAIKNIRAPAARPSPSPAGLGAFPLLRA
jgi:diguanylate cyclase (GGDEF)-like protein